MTLTVPVKLLADDAQKALLLNYLRDFNAAANEAARIGFLAGQFSQVGIHHLCYQTLRTQFGVSSQTAVRAIGKAVECFRRDRKVCPTFRSLGAAVYDQRTYRIKGDKVSLLTPSGRIHPPIVVAEVFKENFRHHTGGQADLVYRGGEFYLLLPVATPEQPMTEVVDYLGVDLGIINLATDSTGERHSGAEVERARKRSFRARSTFQRKKSRSAKRRLRKLSGRQARHQKQVNHTISKRIVAKAKALGLGIAVEDLTGLRRRVEPTVGRKRRRKLSNWGFHQLRLYLTYKSRLAGVPLVTVDPAYTSQRCYACGHTEKANRLTQDQFHCVGCGHVANADHNAALNISRLGATVNRPHQCPA